MKIYGTVTDISEKTELAKAKLQFEVEGTELLTVFTDNQGRFEAEQDLSSYIGKQLKVTVEKDNYEDRQLLREISREDIAIDIELAAVKLVDAQAVVPEKKTEKKPYVEPVKPTNNRMMIVVGAACAVVLAIVVIYYATRPEVNIKSFQAAPKTIIKGKSAKLRWRTKKAETVTIKEIGPELLGPNGEIEVTPQRTTTYTLIAKGKNSRAIKRCKVIVKKPMGPIVPAVPMHGLQITNETACKKWCAQHHDTCRKCSELRTCGPGYERVKSWTGTGKDWFACKKR
jgi:hypothetical protein